MTMRQLKENAAEKKWSVADWKKKRPRGEKLGAQKCRLKLIPTVFSVAYNQKLLPPFSLPAFSTFRLMMLMPNGALNYIFK